MEWIPLVDYAARKGVSLSTLRRYIKANKIPYRLEEGRYLILSDEADLRTELQRANEEIAELKTLIALYEERTPPSPDLR
jgi:predicted site-specific integrase-resolvase